MASKYTRGRGVEGKDTCIARMTPYHRLHLGYGAHWLYQGLTVEYRLSTRPVT